MKIRKLLYITMFGILMLAQMTYAQQNMFVVDNNGNVNVVSVSSVDYATFYANSKWFTITNDSIEAATTTSISALCTVGFAADSGMKELTSTPYVGVCYSKDDVTPTISDECDSLGTQLKSYTFTLWPLISGTTYYYRIYVKIADRVFYGDVAKAKTLGTKPNDETINIHKFIDLGLPSGLLWAETNIGAENAADDGNYYAWGETEPQRLNQYSWSSYKYGTGTFHSQTKYNTSDNKTTLDNEDDAAYVNWGSAYRMPTKEEFDELRNSSNCTWTWTSMANSDGSSVYGYKITSIKNGNSIFLPASSSRCDENLYGRGRFGYYWSNTLNSRNSTYSAYILSFRSGDYSQSSSWRCYGCSIRPVAEP